MADDPIVAMVAFLFQRSGRTGMSENELANAVSLDLKWYAPKPARELIAGLVRAGWLQRDDEGDLEPTFDVKAVKVPISFRPPRDVPKVPPPGTYTQQNSGPAPSDSRPEPSEAATEPPQQQTTVHSAAQPAAEPAEATSEAPEAAEPDDAPDTLLGRLLEQLAAETGEDRGVWVARMDAVVQHTRDAVAPEVALLVAAGKEGVPVDAWLDEARKML